MEQTKISFFIRVKNAIFNFDKYQIFAGEKVISAIKYILKLILILSIILTIILTYKFTKIINKTINEFQEEIPEFKFEDYKLIIEGDNKQFIKEDEDGYFTIIIDSEKENINDVQNVNFKNTIVFLKDKIVLNYNNTQTEMLYSQINEKYDINNITKANMAQFMNQKEMIRIYIMLAITILITAFIVYIIQVLFDILLLSLLGYIISKIIKIKFKYGMIFNMCVYSITLPVILLYSYLFVNILTGFTITYFTIAYNSIAYIYIITAMLMIKSDIIKQQIEVARIVEEQKKVKEEIEEENKEEEEKGKKEEKEKKEESKKKNKKEDTDNGATQGSKA